MLYRTLALPLHRATQRAMLVLLQGPRGAGKTTLLRRELPGHTYVALDDQRDRARARAAPERFLTSLRGAALVDDAHRAPELVAYLAASPPPNPLVLASAHRLVLPAAETLELHRPTRAERQRRPPLPLEMLGRFAPSVTHSPGGPVTWPVTWPVPWPEPRSFLDLDVRELVRLHDVDRFEAFLRAARDRTGHWLDQQALANECGVAHRTVVRWLAVLDTCFLTLTLPPTSQDFGRRTVRRPKLHFLEHAHFESEVVSEIYRNAHHTGDPPNLRHWRDSNGFAIPLIIESETALPVPVVIAPQPTPADLAGLRRWMSLAGTPHGAVIGLTKPAARSANVLRYSLAEL